MLPPDVPDPRAVLAAFGRGGAVESYVEVDGGWSNRVLRLRSDGDDLAVKEIRNPWGVARWRDWLDEGWRLERAALAAGIAAPEPLVDADGGFLAEVERADGSGSAWVRVHRWADGRSVPRDPVDPEVARWAGGAVAVVHRLALRPIRPALYVERAGLTTADVWPDLVSRASRAGARWAVELEAYEPMARRASALLEPVDEDDAVLVHGDLDQKNLLIAEGGPVLLDWDVVVPAAPSHDLAHAALALAAWRAPDIARAVLDGHAREAGATTLLRPSDLGPALASRLGWIRFSVDRALDAAAQGEVDLDAAGHEIVPLLKDAVRRVEISEQIGEWLEGRSPA